MHSTEKPPERSIIRRFFAMPQTQLGESATIAFGIHVILMIVFQLLVSSGQTGGETFVSNPWLAATILLAGAAAVIGGVVAIAAFVRQGERSVIVAGIILYGVFVAAFGLGEVLAPH